MTRTAIVIGALLLAPVARAEPDEPYLYQRVGAVPQSARVEAETAIGTREVRPFGESGIEQSVRGRARIVPWLAADLRAGVVLDADGVAGGSVLGALEARVLDAEVHPLGIALAAGGGVDARGDPVLRGQLVLASPRRSLHGAILGALEVPLAADRDAVDLIVGMVGSVAAGSRVRVGIELLAEDLEGFWEAEEAEGGARLLGGPTAWLDLGGGWDLRVNVGGVLAFPPLGGEPTPGLLARAGAGLAF
jgi:hypothetical protein